MKKIITFLLLLAVMLPLASCSTSIAEDPNQILLDALIIASDTFHNPSDVRLLDIGDSQFHYDEDAHAVYECVKVRLQGANKVGGVSDGYYLLCLSQTGGKEYAWSLAANEFDSSSYYKKSWDECSESEYPKNTYDTFGEYRESMINHYLENNFFHTEVEKNKHIEDEAKENWDSSSSNEYPHTSFSTYDEYLEVCYRVNEDDYFIVKDYDKDPSQTDYEKRRDENFGKLVDTKESGITFSEENTYDVPKINKKLNEYWAKRLGNAN